MNNDLTEMVFVLDKSGSMHGLEEDTIGGFNAMLDGQKKLEGDAYVTTLLFNGGVDVLHDRLPIKMVPDLSEKEYRVGGPTALLDAVGTAIHHIETIHKYAREEDIPARTIIVINTDGLENASRDYSYDEVKDMVEKERGQNDWEFIFLGANMDAIRESQKIGIRADRVASYYADKESVQANYESLDRVLRDYRGDRPIGNSWKSRIESMLRNKINQ